MIEEYRKYILLFGLGIIGTIGLWYLSIYSEHQRVLKKKNAFEQLNYIVKMQIKQMKAYLLRL